MKKILFVCLGNICRSPLGEGIMKKIAEEENIELQVDSCGTSAYHVGELPDPRSIDVALNHHVDIRDQRSRKLDISDFYNFDFILAMDRSNLSNIYDKEPKDSTASIHLLREFDTIENEFDVPDPYYGGDSGFEACYQLIFRSCENFAQEKLI